MAAHSAHIAKRHALSMRDDRSIREALSRHAPQANTPVYDIGDPIEFWVDAGNKRQSGWSGRGTVQMKHGDKIVTVRTRAGTLRRIETHNSRHPSQNFPLLNWAESLDPSSSDAARLREDARVQRMLEIEAAESGILERISDVDKRIAIMLFSDLYRVFKQHDNPRPGANPRALMSVGFRFDNNSVNKRPSKCAMDSVHPDLTISLTRALLRRFPQSACKMFSARCYRITEHCRVTRGLKCVGSSLVLEIFSESSSRWEEWPEGSGDVWGVSPDAKLVIVYGWFRAVEIPPITNPHDVQNDSNENPQVKVEIDDSPPDDPDDGEPFQSEHDDDTFPDAPSAPTVVSPEKVPNVPAPKVPPPWSKRTHYMAQCELSSCRKWRYVSKYHNDRAYAKGFKCSDVKGPSCDMEEDFRVHSNDRKVFREDGVTANYVTSEPPSSSNVVSGASSHPEHSVVFNAMSMFARQSLAEPWFVAKLQGQF